MPNNIKYVTANRDGTGEQDYALIMVELNFSIVDRNMHVGIDIVNTSTFERFRSLFGIHDPDFQTLINAPLSGSFKDEIPVKLWNWLENPNQEQYRAEVILGRQPEGAEIVPNWTDTPPAP
jgi:hypothetical protein